MRRTRWRSIAAVSAALIAAALISIGALDGARRPRYGGELRLEMRAAIPSCDSEGAEETEAQAAICGQVFETLVRFDARGQAQPWLASSWTHDAAHHRWIFTLRPNLTLHNGGIFAPGGGAIAAADDKPIEQILRDFARPRNAVRVRAAGGAWVGTGPFRIARWEPGKAVRLEPHENYWRGRPYLDAVEIKMGRAAQDQALDFDTGAADVTEAVLTNIRKLRQHGVDVRTSLPVRTLALVFESEKAGRVVREALSLAIDRNAIQRVLLDRQGEATGALLPQWLTGYAFLFTSPRAIRRVEGSLAFAYDRDDPTLRPIAERIAVNAAEAGITLKPATGDADVKLTILPLLSTDARLALEEFAAMLGDEPPVAPAPVDAERELLEDFQVIPLCHLPLAYEVAPSVHGWEMKPGQALPLDDVWLEPR